MAELEIAPNFGAELKDGFKPVNAWVSNGIAWLDDIQSFYRERSQIELEYSQKLSTLAKKYYEKKAKKSSTLSVGDSPTVTPGSLESASMTTWGVQLTTLESRAAEHNRFANQLITNLAEPIKVLASRHEELRKYHESFAQKLQSERDGFYSDLKKTKGKYDSACQEVENKRKKTESAFDMGRTKAQNAYAQQQADMRNVKNTYLIAINVTNKQKERYYHEYVPDVLDSLQDLAESRVAKLNTLWMTASQLETQVMENSTNYMKHLASEIPRNNPLLDSMMFLRHNMSQWHDPPDFRFEPSPVWLDDDQMATDDASKNFLRNILTKSKGSLGELRRDLDAKRKEVEGGRRVKQAIREGKDKRDEIEVQRSIFVLMEKLHEVEQKKITAEVEVITITQAVGDVSIGAQNHNFKSQTFKIPTNCDLCGERIWGLSAKGFDCRDCGYTCHSKCELKVPADCPGETDKEARKKLKTERQAAAHAAHASPASPNGNSTAGRSEMPALNRSDTMNSMNTLSSGYAASARRSVSGTPRSPTQEDLSELDGNSKSTPLPTIPQATKPAAARSRILAPPPTHYIGDSNGASSPPAQTGKMLYTYQKNAEGEVSIDEGKEITVLEPDDGSGWTKVRAGFGLEGLVPTSYLSLGPAPTTSTRPTSPPRSTSSATHTPTLSTSSFTRPESTYSASSVSLAPSLTGASNKEKKKGPAVAPKRGAKKLQYVEAVYEYVARGEGEHSVREGERMVLVGRDQGDGWCEVEIGGVRGAVPSAYVKDV